MEAESSKSYACASFEPRTQVRVLAPERFAGRTGVVSAASVALENLIVVEMDETDAEDVTGVKVFMAEELEEMEKAT